MKTRTLKVLLIVESVIIVLILMWIFSDDTDGSNKTELLREVSPDGKYVLLIQELGKPSSFYAVDRIKVTLYESNSRELYGTTFRADISTSGSPAKYEIKWLEDGVQIVLSGYTSQYYILPFKTLEDADRRR